MATRFDAAPLQTELDITEPRWRKWFQDMWGAVNAVSLPAASSVTVGASPFTYKFAGGGQSSLIVSGGTVSLIEFSRSGSIFFTIANASPGMFSLSNGDSLRITYTVAPTVTLVLR